MRRIRRRTAAAALGVVMVGALAACGDDNGDTNDTADTGTDGATQETVTVTEQPTDEQTGDQTAGQTEDPAVATGADGGSVTTLVFDGTDMAAQFASVSCQMDDDGEMEIDLRADGSNDHVEIDLELNGDARVDGLGVELDGKEWDSTDAQEQDATVEVDGDTYRVNGQVEVDDDHPDAGDVAELEVEVSCV